MVLTAELREEQGERYDDGEGDVASVAGHIESAMRELVEQCDRLARVQDSHLARLQSILDPTERIRTLDDREVAQPVRSELAGRIADVASRVGAMASILAEHSERIDL